MLIHIHIHIIILHIIDSLKDRREKLCVKFAKKCLKLENMKKLFPFKKTKHFMKKRKFEKYLINNINTERYKRSAVPYTYEENVK